MWGWVVTPIEDGLPAHSTGKLCIVVSCFNGGYLEKGPSAKVRRAGGASLSGRVVWKYQGRYSQYDSYCRPEHGQPWRSWHREQLSANVLISFLPRLICITEIIGPSL